MTIKLAPDTVLRRKGRAVARKVVNETLLVPIRGDVDQMHHVFVMNPVAEFLWNQFDGSRPLEALVDAVCDNFDVSHEQADGDVRAYADHLLAEDLIEAV